MLGLGHKDMQYAGTGARSEPVSVPGSGLGLRLSSGHNKSTKWLLQLLLLLSLCCCCCCCFHTKLSKSFRIKKLDVRISQKLPPHYIESWFWAGVGGGFGDGFVIPPSLSPMSLIFIWLPSDIAVEVADVVVSVAVEIVFDVAVVVVVVCFESSWL